MLRNVLLLAIASSALASCSSDPASGTDSGPQSAADAGHADAGSATDAGPLVAPDAYSATDPNAALRAMCIAEINRLRATRGLPPYTMWTGVEMCTDAQATSDETNHAPHQAFGMHAGVCDGNGQNECEGQGSNIVACLDQMWGERDQPGCSGCDACADAYDPSCPNCDFFGTSTGNVCGHYVNMSARYFMQAACGFSSLGGWDVINFR